MIKMYWLSLVLQKHGLNSSKITAAWICREIKFGQKKKKYKERGHNNFTWFDFDFTNKWENTKFGISIQIGSLTKHPKILTKSCEPWWRSAWLGCVYRLLLKNLRKSDSNWSQEQLINDQLSIPQSRINTQKHSLESEETKQTHGKNWEWNTAMKSTQNRKKIMNKWRTSGFYNWKKKTRITATHLKLLKEPLLAPRLSRMTQLQAPQFASAIQLLYKSWSKKAANSAILTHSREWSQLSSLDDRFFCQN